MEGRYYVRFNKLPGGPDEPAEFIELEDEHGRGVGSDGGAKWIDDPDNDSVLLAIPTDGGKLLRFDCGCTFQDYGQGLASQQCSMHEYAAEVRAMLVTILNDNEYRQGTALPHESSDTGISPELVEQAKQVLALSRGNDDA